MTKKVAVKKATPNVNDKVMCVRCKVEHSELSPPSIYCTACMLMECVRSHDSYNKWKKAHGLPTETREAELERIIKENEEEVKRKRLRLNLGGVAG